MNGLTVRRTSAFFVLMALVASITVIGAPVALAHHPEVSASSYCDRYEPVISFSAESWATGAKGSNANVGIYVDGDWVTSGVFTDDNGYSFDGTLPAAAWVGQTVTVMARADGPWGNGTAAGDSRATTVFVTDDCGGTTTTEQQTTTTEQQTTTTEQQTTTTEQQTTTVAEYGASVSFDIGYCRVVYGVSQTPVTVTIEPAGSVELTIESSGVTHQVDATSTLMLEPGDYTWTAQTAAGFALNGSESGSFKVADCTAPDAMVTVRVGECRFNVETGASTTDVRVSIAPNHGARVVIDGPGGPHVITGGGAILDLVPGDYTWQATSQRGHALVGPAKGSFTIDDCSPECTAAIGDYVWLDMDPRNGLQDEGEEFIAGASVELLDNEGAVLATTVTDATGYYRFADLCDDVYRVRFQLPDVPGLVNEAWTDQVGGNALRDSNADSGGLTDEIIVIDGTNDMSWDAGIVGDTVSSTTATTIITVTTPTTVPETPTTTVPETPTTSVAEVAPTTVAPTTSTTVGATSSTTVPEVTASTLPFTGFELQATALLGLLALAGGTVLIFGLRRTPEQDGDDVIGRW